MVSLFVGFFTIALVMFFSLNGDLHTYVQFHSFLIVVGGTVAVLLTATPTTVLKSMFRSLLQLLKTEQKFRDFADEFAQLSRNRGSVVNSKHPLIQYAIQLWVQGTSEELFIPLLSQKRRELEVREMDATFALKNLTKYPPTLGMTGTVMGMITLFANLDSSKDKIGSSLSIAMTATFFGLILANLVIAPLADRMHVRQVSQQRLLDQVYEILLLIHHDEPAALIGEEIKDRVA